MQIAITAIGTRGDVQPILALAQGIQSAGHQVRLIAGENFRGWVELHGFDFTPSTDIETLVNSPDGIAWVENGHNSQAQLKYMQRLIEQFGDPIAASIMEGAQGADLLLTGFISESVVQAVAEKYQIPMVRTLLQPYIPTQRGSNILIPLLARQDSILNRWWGHFGQRIMWLFFRFANKYRQQWGLKPHTFASYYAQLRQAPVLQGFSRHVVPPAADIAPYIHTTGFWFLDEDGGWQPPQDLSGFLSAGEKPVYVGFGSMPSSDPEKRLHMMIEAVQKSGQRGIIGSIGDLSISNLPENIFLLKSAPHRWLFPQMAGVIHHGGAGTTAAGLRAGIPALIVPHMADQPYWGRRVHELGVGLKPIQRYLLTADNLAEGIQALVSDPQMKQNAAELGQKVQQERGIENAVMALEGIMMA
jgi:sterol 3beta-glucosyltransferase